MAIARSTVTAVASALRILSRPWRWVSPWRIAVAAPIVLNLVLLTPQLQSVENVNDSTFHVAMIRWAQRQIASGHIPLDGWFPNFSLGASQFHHYQSLPAILTAYLSGPLGAETTYLLSLYLLLSLWPLSVYWGARLLGRSRSEAGIAALLSPLLMSAAGYAGAYGFEANTYTWQGYGLWTQLWGMVLLPPALGLTWRAIERRGRAVVPAIVIALTIACALIVGYMALVGVGSFAIVVRERWRPRVIRAMLIAGAAILLASWVLVPLVSDQTYQSGVGSIANGIGKNGASFYESFGTQQVFSWLMQGQLFDYGHLPVISVLAGVGAMVCIGNWRRDTAGRGILVLALLSLLLFIGPASIPLLKLLPGGTSIQFSRFVGCLQMAALLLAGIGGRWVFFHMRDLFVGGLSRLRSRQRIPLLLERTIVPLLLAAGVAVVVLSPVLGLISYDTNGAALIALQAERDAAFGPYLAPLLTAVAQLDHGRTYAGATFNWGSNYVIGFAPIFEELSNRDIDQVGLTGRIQSLSEGPEFFFDEHNLADYQAFAVHYLILPASMKPPVAATKLEISGQSVLWQVTGVQPGYVRVVDTVGPTIAADNGNLDSASQEVMKSTVFAHGYYQTVAFAGMSAAAPSLPSGVATGSPGRVSHEVDNLDNGEVHASATAARPAVALLSASYDNRWTATVDGVAMPTQMIAPTLLGVAVPAGTHTVEFRYASYPWYWFWFLVMAGTLVLMFRPGIAVAVGKKLLYPPAALMGKKLSEKVLYDP